MWFATGRQYGSENGSALDERVASLLADPTTVRRYATTIRDVAPSLRDEPAEGEAEFTAEEGALLKRFHLDRERNSGAVRRKKQRALASGRPIECEVCGVDVASLYGVPDGSIIECHHRRPLAEGVRQTTLDDLALVCPSCHRALHRIQPWTTVEALRERVRGR
ncbi:MAG TPA: HNH endonuclease [Mycobacteriales bacterium]|nr:HNH endonuclease [Mycobacteriales bacterium]